MTEHRKAGAVLILIGAISISISGFFVIDNIKDINAMHTEVSRREIEVPRPEVDTTTTESTLVELKGVESLDEDMQMADVTAYQNVMEIPTLDILAPLREGTTKAALKQGIGHVENTPLIGEVGNACYAGHYSEKYEHVFNNLPNIKLYDEVWGYGEDGTKYVYYVVDRYIVAPTDVSVLDTTSKTDKQLTLITCCNNTTLRLIIVCKMLTPEQLLSIKEENQRERRQRLEEIVSSIENISVSSYILDRNRVSTNTYYVPAMYPHSIDNCVDNMILFKER